MKLTFFWMDMLRQRLKAYPFKSSKDKALIKDFIAPVMLMGTEAERDVSRQLKKDKQRLRRSTALESRNFRKLQTQWKRSLKK
jgi:hypothetical protein